IVAEPGSVAEVVTSPSARGSKRPHPDGATQAESDDDETPKVLNFAQMSKLEKEKVRRIVSPKKATGNLEVPENIFEMWKDAGAGRDKLTCEYDDETLEYWVNVRTSGTLTQEDLEQIERKQKFEGEGGDELNFNPRVHLDGFTFEDDNPMVHTSTKNLEGDQHKSALGLHVHAASQMKEYMKSLLKAKNSLEGFADKIRASVAGDAKAEQTIKKIDGMIKEHETLYYEMAEAKAEG
ncbi:unnamed protein product, partial [Symbiodinium sp. KB8]